MAGAWDTVGQKLSWYDEVTREVEEREMLSREERAKQDLIGRLENLHSAAGRDDLEDIAAALLDLKKDFTEVPVPHGEKRHYILQVVRSVQALELISAHRVWREDKKVSPFNWTIVDANKNTFLHRAVLRGNLASGEIFSKHVSWEAVNSAGKTALELAVDLGSSGEAMARTLWTTELPKARRVALERQVRENGWKF